MKRYRWADFGQVREGHILGQVMPGERIYRGGVAISLPGQRSHTNDGPGGIDYHIHDDCEVFIILQGQGKLELDHQIYPLVMGDVVIIEPGEDHHLIGANDNPLVTLYFHVR